MLFNSDNKKMEPVIPPDLIAVLDRYGYDVISLVGKGGFAECYKVYSRRYKMDFCCKAITRNNKDGFSEDQSYSNEYTALTHSTNPYIIQIFEKIVQPKKAYLILEYCPNGNLQQYISNNGPITDTKDFISILRMMLNSLQYLEANHFAHNDIKPSNFLLDKYYRIKLTDFGLAKVVDNDHKFSDNFAGSLPFLSPEIVNQHPYDPFKADIWAFGITVYYLATGDFPFECSTISDLKKSQQLLSVQIPHYIDPIIKNIITRCLKRNPRERPTFSQLFKFIETLPKEDINNNSCQQGKRMISQQNSCKVFPPTLKSSATIFRPSLSHTRVKSSVFNLKV